ncbi:ImmA/IrrE family metallo-endopeptidase [Candidatus Bodocaedibacter vickermanii]|uniref:ImmA/IrrE family metallo-endopeptidase n=1 Tax=Candidatus Bodocaedibacter vickermanii TaxID=2741701 RepID=A0A7L9RT58_9PROT|nr:ImmA/IrrE family metallo-endopeptidase [Candidatus Paracaedibacteraceae bacterium 'Lake Konstanz']
MQTNPDYSASKKRASEILEEASIIQPPIITQKLCETYGIKVKFVIFTEDNISGMMDFKSNTIYVNDQEGYARNNFTIAHELGHYFLHKDYYLKHPNEYEILYRKPISSAQNSPIEKEANTFAAHLLVPKKFLDQYYEFASIQSLAKLFAVSEEVISYRLKNEYGF